MRDGDDLGPRRQQLGKVFEIETIVLRQPRPPQHGAFALAQKVPGDDIGVMLHLGDDDFVARHDLGCPDCPRRD